jgi:hypothetical protein
VRALGLIVAIGTALAFVHPAKAQATTEPSAEFYELADRGLEPSAVAVCDPDCTEYSIRCPAPSGAPPTEPTFIQRVIPSARILAARR